MKLGDWQVRYHAAIDDALSRPFGWGTHDCVTFACAVYEAVSDGDAAARMRAQFQWTSARDAARTLADLGGLKAACELILGPGDPAWLKLGVGDLMLAANSDGSDILAVCDGHHLLVPRLDVGLAALPLRSAKLGWRT